MPAFVGILEGETRPERTGDVEDEADGFWDRGVGGVVGDIRIELSRQDRGVCTANGISGQLHKDREGPGRGSVGTYKYQGCSKAGVCN